MIFKQNPDVLKNSFLTPVEKLIYLYCIPWINWRLKSKEKHTTFYFGYVAKQLGLTATEVKRSFLNLNEVGALISSPLKTGVNVFHDVEDK
ncbi:hypothetical protein [Citrobacter portucalensis]|uniref:hypothetical protein n=1 Tax=Citrobacter portucalensis TaxID=1639133 RepID=UPI00255192B0|nr:hypothetical protein [Citrobacter portucalensis]